MIVVLAEKPSVAKDIARFLKAVKKEEGYFEGNGYQVTWAFGHLVTVKEPDEYDPLLKKWSLATLPFIPATFELKVVEEAGIRKQFNVIKKLLKSARQIICATDAGREGELIFRYILKMAQCTHQPWKRVWLSSLTDEAMAYAFQHMKEGSQYDNLYAAAKCRQEADWIIGLNATRNYTVRYGFGKNLWTIGRVQTPILAMIVNREDEISSFQSEPFWELLTKYKEVTFKHKAPRFTSLHAAEECLQHVRPYPLIIQKLERKKENDFPPLLFDLTELQREMNRKLGMTAADVLQAAQTLYEQKLITYPRTDSRYLTEDMKGSIPSLLHSLRSFKKEEIEKIDLTKISYSARTFNNKKVSDHHAIIPTGKVANALLPHLFPVYEAIVTRLIANFYPVCVKEVTTIEAKSHEEEFQARGIKVLMPGWTTLYPKKKEESKDLLQELPDFREGEEGEHFPFIKEGKTSPPLSYTESSLLGAMETAGKFVEDEQLKEALKERGLGTPATRAAMIETLIKRGYIQRAGKSLVALDLGRYLIALIQDPQLKSPELTGEWEAKLKKIEQGQYKATEFMEHIAIFTHHIIKNNLTEINEEKYGSCPRCQHEVIKGKRGFGCSRWKEGCHFVLWPHYQEILLTEHQIRSLLQKRILLQPIAGKILHLTEKGELTAIPLPIANKQGSKKAYYQKKKKEKGFGRGKG